VPELSDRDLQTPAKEWSRNHRTITTGNLTLKRLLHWLWEFCIAVALLLSVPLIMGVLLFDVLFLDGGD